MIANEMGGERESKERNNVKSTKFTAPINVIDLNLKCVQTSLVHI